MAVLSACTPATGTTTAPTPVPFITPAAPFPSVATPSPTSTPLPAALPPAGAASAAALPVAMVRSGTFPLVAVSGSHASGLVQVTDRAGSFVASVSVQGLASGMPTLHTVHIHAGSCANPYGGLHLTVLGLLHASAAGAGTLSAPLAPFYVANGHYVIVYANTSPQVIVGCANLTSLS